MLKYGENGKSKKGKHNIRGLLDVLNIHPIILATGDWPFHSGNSWRQEIRRSPKRYNSRLFASTSSWGMSVLICITTYWSTSYWLCSRSRKFCSCSIKRGTASNRGYNRRNSRLAVLSKFTI